MTALTILEKGVPMKITEKPRHTHLVWDFNGTVLDDVLHGVRCVNPMLEARGLAPIPDVATYRTLFDFPIEDYYRRLGFDFEKESYDTVLAPEWVARYVAGEADCTLNEGVTETLAAVRAMGVPQLMLSASRLEQLLAQLERLGLSDAFSEVLGLDNIHARSKTHLAEAWRERHPDARPLFVGDTVHDAAVARAIGADCVLFTGGHQCRERLASCGVPLIDRIEYFLNYL